MLLWLLFSLICVVSLRNNYFGRGFINKLQLQTNIIIITRFSIWRIWIRVGFFSFFLFFFNYLLGCAGSQLRLSGLSAFVVAHRMFSCGMQILSCGMWDLISCPGIKPGPLVFGAQSLSHWTTREILDQHGFLRVPVELKDGASPFWM